MYDHQLSSRRSCTTTYETVIEGFIDHQVEVRTSSGTTALCKGARSPMDRSTRARPATNHTQCTSTCWLHYCAPHRHCSPTWCALPLELVENLRVAIRLGATMKGPLRRALQLEWIRRFFANGRHSSLTSFAANDFGRIYLPGDWETIE